MAFNPFSTFQKNQKFWMAAILIVCMIVFVGCTGTGVEIQNSLIYYLKGTGPTVVRVARHNLSAYDLGRLRDQRNAVNAFMRHSAQATVDNLTKGMQDERAKPEPTEA